LHHAPIQRSLEGDGVIVTYGSQTAPLQPCIASRARCALWLSGHWGYAAERRSWNSATEGAAAWALMADSGGPTGKHGVGGVALPASHVLHLFTRSSPRTPRSLRTGWDQDSRSSGGSRGEASASATGDSPCRRGHGQPCRTLRRRS